MRYHCASCDHTFEHEGEEDPRCPRCLRAGDLREVAGEGAGSARRWILPSVAILVAAAAVGGFFYWKYEQRRRIVEGEEVPTRPLASELLQARLEHEDVEAGDLAGLLRAEGEIEAFAAQAASDAGDATAKASAIVDALRSRADDGAWRDWSRNEPLDRDVLAASKALTALRSEEPTRFYPLEVAALAAASLRALDVDAVLAEIHAYEGDEGPLDPSGRLGYYGVAVYPEGQTEPKLYDPYGGRDAEPQGFEVLTDPQAVAAAMSVRAQYKLVREGAPSEASKLSKQALALLPRSPTARGVRGAVLLAAGGMNDGMKELESALQLHADPARHNNLAQAYLAQGDSKAAARHVTQALQAAPRFAAGHATLAGVHLMSNEPELARSELEQAERLDPSAPSLASLWANYYARKGDTQRAIAHAKRAVKDRPHDTQARLLLGRLYRQAGRYDAMRKQARAVMDSSPASQRAATRRLVEQVLGPTAFDEPMAEAEASEETGPLDLKLDTSDSRLLGSEGQKGSAPTAGLLPPASAGEKSPAKGKQEPLLMLGDPSKLELQDPGMDLKLKLDE